VSARKKERQLKSLNKVIAKGREKYALHMSLAIVVGFGISKLLVGGFFSWLLMGAWASFITVFVITYFLWPRNIVKAKKIAAELEGVSVMVPPEKSIRSLIVAGVVLALLVSPFLFKGEIARWAVKQQKNAVVELQISSEDGEIVKLKIPQLYIIKQHNEEIGYGLMDTELQKELVLTATLSDMQPLPVATKKFSSHERYKQTPLSDKNVVFLRMQAVTGALNEGAIQAIYDKASKEFPDSLSEKEEWGLAMKTSKAKVSAPNGKGELTGTLMLGVPTDSGFGEDVVFCDEKLCNLMMNIESLPIFNIKFHESQLKNWQDIHKKSTDLIQTFIQ